MEIIKEILRDQVDREDGFTRELENVAADKKGRSAVEILRESNQAHKDSLEFVRDFLEEMGISDAQF